MPFTPSSKIILGNNRSISNIFYYFIISVKAALTNQTEVVEYLLSLHAAVFALGHVDAGPPADLLGITPVDVARAAGYAILAEKLQQHFKNCSERERKQSPQLNGGGAEHKVEA